MIGIYNFFYTLLQNKVFLAVSFSWMASAIIKMMITLATEKHPGLSGIYRSGGMPSTHTASVVGLTLGVYLFNGVDTLFIVTLALAIVVIHDSMGVRLEAEKHAQFLNQLIKRMKFDTKYFSEHIGHKIPQVIVGAIIGLIVPLIIYFI